MRSAFLLALTSCSLVMANGAFAADATDSTGPMPVIGTVPALCAMGTSTEDGNIFDVGILVDTTTGLLLPNLAPDIKTITASFCNTQSTITVTAEVMEAQSFVPPLPEGFSASVDYTATASGWTTSPAVFETGAVANPAATQTRFSAFSGDIDIALTDFSTVGGDNLRLVADPLYQGIVTVTLAAGN